MGSELLAGRRGVALRVAIIVVLGLGLTEVWAHARLDRSAAARAIVWFEADVDDLNRFPSRPVPASPTTLTLAEPTVPADLLSHVTVGDDPVALGDLVETTETEALLVLRDRDLVYERYANGGAADRLHTSFSIAKSFVSTLLGIAIERGEVGSLDDPVTDYVPELKARDPRFTAVTLRDLASMASGICYSERMTPWSDDTVSYYSPDLRTTALGVDICRVPGEEWHYNNFNPLLLGLVLERATGTSVSDYMARHLWGPMGAEADASWSLDSEWSGFEKMESGVNAVPRDFARFGHLVAHGGRVLGRQVVDREWISAATARDTGGDPAEHYQLSWWVETDRPGRFSARGNKGQFIYVDPRSEVVVVRLGRDGGGVDWIPVLRDLADQAASLDLP